MNDHPGTNLEFHPDRQLTEREAAEFLGMQRQTLADWRCSGRVRLPFVKLGPGKRSPVRYRLGDLLDFIEACRVVPRGVRS